MNFLRQGCSWGTMVMALKTLSEDVKKGIKCGICRNAIIIIPPQVSLVGVPCGLLKLPEYKIGLPHRKVGNGDV